MLRILHEAKTTSGLGLPGLNEALGLILWSFGGRKGIIQLAIRIMKRVNVIATVDHLILYHSE